MTALAPKAGSAALAAALLNPATATALAIGLVGFGLYKLLQDDAEEGEDQGAASRSNTRPEPLATVAVDLDPILAPTAVPDGPALADDDEPPAMPGATTSDLKILPAHEDREAIRRYMSDLGKRSAAARRRKSALAP